MTVDPDDRRFLALACELATASASSQGGPFGAVVVRDGEIVATGINRVTEDRDPSAHAEVVALRVAGATLGTHDLAGCAIYTSCEPCPMCLAACWWAHVERIVYAATEADAAAAGFDDRAFRAAMGGEWPLPVRPEHIELPGALEPFSAWAANPDQVSY